MRERVKIEITGLPKRINKAWSKGLSGHPLMGRRTIAGSRKKKIKNLDTGAIFESLSKTKQTTGNLSKAIRNGTKCGGYHWAYCDENGKVIK